MARRRGGFEKFVTQVSRELERQAKASARAQIQYQRQVERANRIAERERVANHRAAEKQVKETQRASNIATKEAEKEQKRLYIESREDEVKDLNDELAETLEELEGILSASLLVDDFFDIKKLKKKPKKVTKIDFVPIAFKPGKLAREEAKPDVNDYRPAPFIVNASLLPVEPEWNDYIPTKTVLTQILPGQRKEYDKSLEAAKQQFHGDLAAWKTAIEAGAEKQRREYNATLEDAKQRYLVVHNSWKKREAERITRLEESKKAHDDKLTRLAAEHEAVYKEKIAAAKAKVAEQNAEVERFAEEYKCGMPEAVVEYCTLVLANSYYPESFPRHVKIGYVPESKQLVVEYDLPTLDIVPLVSGYKYVKTRDEIVETSRPAAQRKAIYASVLAQMALRTIHELLEADRAQHIDTIVYNGYVNSIDKATGQPKRPCLITVRTTRDVFVGIDLQHVDPAVCLKSLSASVSPSPSELAPVRPVVEFNMVDSRFIEESDILSDLDQRPNLMELTPVEFESLIANLFSKMGLETKLTQSSRDGGVDCVAFNMDPIFGGKFVIQAKRYKNVVGVSAVRDLFGTMQNEGASKGILVTTSHYGKSAFEFANNKPIELIEGGHLLHLLKDHTGLEAKILAPEDWIDPNQNL